MKFEPSDENAICGDALDRGQPCSQKGQEDTPRSSGVVAVSDKMKNALMTCLCNLMWREVTTYVARQTPMTTGTKDM